MMGAQNTKMIKQATEMAPTIAKSQRRRCAIFWCRAQSSVAGVSKISIKCSYGYAIKRSVQFNNKQNVNTSGVTSKLRAMPAGICHV